MAEKIKLLDWFTRKGIDFSEWAKRTSWEEIVNFCTTFKLEPPAKQLWEAVQPVVEAVEETAAADEAAFIEGMAVLEDELLDPGSVQTAGTPAIVVPKRGRKPKIQT
jgi:hypothetical protein